MANIDELLKQYSLQELVNLAEHTGELKDISDIILKLYEQNDAKALDLVIRLFLCDYGGHTFKAEFQNLAGFATLYWGTTGLRRLGEKVIQTGGFRPVNNVTLLLSHISSCTLDTTNIFFASQQYPCISKLELRGNKYKTSEWTIAAKEILIDVIRSVEREEMFPMSVMNNLGHFVNESAQEHIFAALIARWFNFSAHGLEDFLTLINSKGKPEIEYQNYLKSNPYILEPFHAQIWSKPRFGEKLIPDFLIRSMDNSYVIVEIEQPDFPIFTKAGELSSRVTHAKRQALDFREWAINNWLYATKLYNEIHRPFCLVVIGRETELNEEQQRRLKQENESTQGILKIVGFDWLYTRARSTLDNLVQFGFSRQSFQKTIENSSSLT